MLVSAGLSQHLAELHAVAVRQYNLGRPAASLRSLRRALSRLDAAGDTAVDARLVARIWISVALALAESKSLAAGLEALATAERHTQAAGDPAVTVLLHCQRGLIELRAGSMRRAQDALDAAIKLLEHAPPREQASILINRGTLGLIAGRLPVAAQDLQQAVAITSRAGLSTEQFKALHNLAYVRFLQGDLPGALRSMDEAGEIRADVSRGVWLLDRARVLSEAGLVREAERVLEEAKAVFKTERQTLDLAETELEQARCALALGDTGGARRNARSARDRFRRRGNVRGRRSAEILLLQAELAGGASAERLATAASALSEEFQREGLRLLSRVAGLLAAEAHLAGGRLAAAGSALAELGPARATDPITGRMHTQYVQARVDEAADRPGAARRRIGRALADLAEYQASFGSIDLRTASAVHGRRLADLDVELALRSGRPAAVLGAVERARAVSARLPAVRPPADPLTAELLAELRQTIDSLRAVEQDRQASVPLLRRRRELERQIVARSWSRSGAGRGLHPAGVDAVRSELATTCTTMITFLQVAGRLSAVVLGERTALHDLGRLDPVVEQARRVRADLDVAAQPRLPGGIRAAVRTSLERSLQALDDALLRPLRAAGPVVIVSTGVLGQLPWASLPSLRGRPLTVAPSATKWLASAAAGPALSPTVAALSGPDLGRGTDEALAVGKVWAGASVTSGADATSAALLDAMGSASVLHVAAHGVHQPENPLFSFVRMADGPVFAHELDQTHRAPDHVILSACEVGLATIRPGDEALGLASVLLHLGTRSVVASVARVGDEVAERTMAAYHRRLAAGDDSSAALSEALVEVDADVTPPFVNFGAAWAPGRAPADLEPAPPVA